MSQVLLTQQEFPEKTRLDHRLNFEISLISSQNKWTIVDASNCRVSFKYKTHHLRKRWVYVIIKAKSKKKLYKKLDKISSSHRRLTHGGRFPNRSVETKPVYVSKRIMDEYLFVCDLFCFPKEEIPELRIYPKVNKHSGRYGHGDQSPHYALIRVGALGGVAMTTIIHELVHAMGYGHERNINGYSDFHTIHGVDYFSPLICQDIYGKKEVIIE